MARKCVHYTCERFFLPRTYIRYILYYIPKTKILNTKKKEVTHDSGMFLRVGNPTAAGVGGGGVGE